MSFHSVRHRIVARLAESDRGDRGWFIITRVHVALSWLQAITAYLNSLGGGFLTLTDADYEQLGLIVDTENADPGVQLRRHHLLVMDKPLRLLERADDRSWAQIALTERGRELASADEPAAVLERSLKDIRFAVAPWAPPDRVEQYHEFDIQVYAATLRVMERCDGLIDRDEFDFFVSRIRHGREIAWAIEGIQEFRELEEEQRRQLRDVVRGEIPSEKRYQNWRDVALHTFSLFSLGTSMIREGQRLILTTAVGAEQSRAEPNRRAAAVPPLPRLRMPDPPEAAGLLTPPAMPASNVGADAESFVAKVLRSRGWQVAFYTNRRGYGFDLWARLGERAMLIEVKSSLGELGAIVMTPTEYEAARANGDGYVLALVEHASTANPTLTMIQNPVDNLRITARNAMEYAISRSSWRRAAGTES